MAADADNGADLKIIRKILKEDIAARKLILSIPGLTAREKLRHNIYIAAARIHRITINNHEATPFV